MSAPEAQANVAVVEVPRTDPFVAPRAEMPGRPRLASYAGRTGRARRWLPPDALRVLDVGCATGYGAAGIAVAGPPDRVVIGVERDPEHLATARRYHPWLTVMDADATELPVADGCADAVLLLDILEHLEHPQRALAEAHRVLRPGGVLIASVPHAGLLQHLDALNVYSSLVERRPALRGLEPSTESGGGRHKHYSLREFGELLSPWFQIDRVARTGLGIAEPLMLGRLLIRATGRAARLWDVLFWLYFFTYLAEDVMPMGRLGYHLTVRARSVEAARATLPP